jgi:putative ABC transport system ATP-binding protein
MAWIFYHGRILDRGRRHQWIREIDSLHAIAGGFFVDAGTICFAGRDVTGWREHQRAKFVGRPFQSPFSGTAANMSIEENLLLRRGGDVARIDLGAPLEFKEALRERVRRLNLWT